MAATRDEGVQIAFMNAGGIRQDLDVGADLVATTGQVQIVLPFGNTLVAMDMTGAQIRELLDQQWLRPGSADPSVLQISDGFSYTWNPAAPRGQRVVPGSLMLGGVAMDERKTYRVAANNFLAEGGDNFPAFKVAANKRDTNVRDLDALTAYLVSRAGTGKPVSISALKQGASGSSTESMTDKENRMNKLAGVVALSCAFVSIDALAWGYDGHRAVGAIAEKLIKGTRRAAGRRPAAAGRKPGIDHQLGRFGQGRRRLSHLANAEQQAYTDVNPRHQEYHYANVPFQYLRYHDGIVGGSDVDIVQTLKQAISVLQGKTDPALNPHQLSRRQALLLVAHMTGDIHQPLHMGSAYVSADGVFAVPENKTEIDAVNLFESRGGNSLLLDDDKLEQLAKPLIAGEAKPALAGAKKWPTKPFHSYWDSTVVEYAMRRSSTRAPDEFAQKMIDTKAEAQIGVARNTGDPATWPYQWANDALAASKRAYSDVTIGKREAQTNKRGETEYKFTLEMGPNYPVPSSDLARTQLVKGGYHLAWLLQSIWPDTAAAPTPAP
ncbi:5'-nucleotidase C-terminal domain-containing protein [Massilia sp. B-10]|nr:5'-nucleotidase C-terminal domain-containing protein [Massilia sp. B-10]